MTLLVTGGRDYNDRAKVYAALDAAHAKRPITLLVVGDCPTGADALAVDWCDLRGVPWRQFVAHWMRHGKAAGPIRNGEMIREGRPDAAVAMPGGAGTADCVRQCEAAGVTVWKPYGGFAQRN